MTRPYQANKLQLDPVLIAAARAIARDIVAQITPFIFSHSTVSVERTILRLFGVDGVNPEGIPLPNVIINNLREQGLLEDGAAFLMAKAFLYYGKEPRILAEELVRDEISLANLPDYPRETLNKLANKLTLPALTQIQQQRQTRVQMIRSLGEGPEPYLYVIVATGNIYEDIVQARAAAYEGADIIAVIRSTGQSLLDYVPYGPTTEGFGGTYATQANFLIMRQALVREVFPRSPIKYMPPTKYMTGNIFRGHVQDALFNVASIMTGQSIHLLGMLTEATHTPLMQDRFLSLEAARLIFRYMHHLGEEISFTTDGRIQRRARETLQQTVNMLGEIRDIGLFRALEKGMFADISRSDSGGRGLDGVFIKSPNYLNPFIELFQAGGDSNA